MKTWSLLFASAAIALLGGCASLRGIDSEVSTFSRWPAQRAPTSFAFDRLPSQQARPEQQQLLEDAARPALLKAGFTPATDPAQADVNVQLGARISPNERSPFDDPFWWNGGLYRGYPYGYGGFGYGGNSGFGGYGGVGYGRFGRPFWPDFGMRYGSPSYEREVAVLIRDRQTGTALYETRASNDGLSPMFGETLSAMFEAAMQGFPVADAAPRRVTVMPPP